MTRGVLYYNHGTRCLPRLLVSLLTLRRHYSGDVAVAAEGEPPAPYRQMLADLGARLVPAPVSHEYGLVKKSRVWRVSPFDVTVFLDADTVVQHPLDELFEQTEKHGLLVTKFHDWRTNGRKMRARIEGWRSKFPTYVDAAMKYGWAINTGIQGWRKDNSGPLAAYEATTAAGLDLKVSKKTLDEIAMQLVVTAYKHFLAGSEWNVGPIHGSVEGAKILHYHGHKHTRAGSPACDLWKREFWSLCERFPEHAASLTKGSPDDSVDLWLGRSFGRRKDLTVVTAVNPAYAERCQKNLKLWLSTAGLKDQKFLVFVNGFRNSQDRKFLDGLPNVKVVRWSYPHPDATDRETMLAAFVLGVAEHVKTDFWLKLDCDSAPKKPYFDMPHYADRAVVSHKWGYTKMKGDPGAKEHWFNRLDKVFTPAAPLFPKLDVKADYQVSHRPGNKLKIPMRFGSFCHFERTSFTRRIAEVVRARCSGRLPIPSQDTLSWYCAYLWREPVALKNMKEWFQP
jgi:hypothetical protein